MLYKHLFFQSRRLKFQAKNIIGSKNIVYSDDTYKYYI